ncbi:VCBS repeat-containing protein [Burkholderiaceae bacterium DAT-1]|nr:VCBS repeat-containing protein [Burkholderiaceae bacterium DAT-1]
MLRKLLGWKSGASFVGAVRAVLMGGVLAVVAPALMPVADVQAIGGSKLTNPTVSLRASATTATAPATITLTANPTPAYDNDGFDPVDSVAIVVNGNVHQILGGAPWQSTLSNLGQGTYNVHAEVVTMNGARAGSAVTTITVSSPVSPPPTFTASRYPAPLVAGRSWSSEWHSTNATSITFNCTASGTGYSGTGSLPPGDGKWDAPSTPDEWIGYPSRCVYTATGPGGSTQFVENLVTYPQVPGVSQTSATSQMGSTLQLSANVSNPNNRPLTVKYFNADTGAVLGQSSSAPYSVSVGGLAAGTYRINVVVTDDFGQSASSLTTITLTPLPLPTFSANRTPTTLTACGQYTSTWSSTNASSVSLSCTASGGGYSVSNLSLPTSGKVTDTASAAWVGYPSSCTWTVSGPGGTIYSNESFSTVAPGLPGVSISVPDANKTLQVANGNATVSLSVTGNASAPGCGSSITQIQVVVDGSVVNSTPSAAVSTTVALSEGQHQIWLTTTDSFGGTAVSTKIPVTVTRAPSAPSVSLDSPSNNATIARNITVSGKATPSVVRIVKTSLLVDGTVYATQDIAGSMGQPSPYSFSVTDLAVGNHTLEVQAWDSQNLMGSSGKSTVTVAGKPVVTLDIPNSTRYVVAGTSAVSFALSASASQSGATIAKLELVVDDVISYTTSNATLNASWSMPVGSHFVEVWATDSLGNVGRSLRRQVSSYIAVVPSISLSKPTANAAYTRPDTINLSASVRQSGSGDIRFFASGPSGQDQFLGNPSSYDFAGNPLLSVSTSTFVPGNYTFFVAIKDEAGQQARSPDVKVTISAQPQVSVSEPANNTVLTQSGTVTIKGTASESLGRISKLSLFVDGKEYPQSGSGVQNQVYAFSIVSPVLTGGDHTLSIKVWDDFNGVAISPDIKVKVAQKPTIQVTRIPSTMLSNYSYTSAWSTTDADSVTLDCTTTGTGYQVSGLQLATSGSVTDTAKAEWVGYPSSCTWTAKGVGGTATKTETLTTIAGAPGIKGEVSGVYISADGKTFVEGWVCQAGQNKAIGYKVFVGAQPDANATATGAGTASALSNDVSTSTTTANIVTACGDALGHYFKHELTSLTGYNAATVYVQAVPVATATGASPNLPCTGNCQLTAGATIGFSTPKNGQTYGGGNVFMSTQVGGVPAGATVTAVRMQVGTQAAITAQADSSLGAGFYSTQMVLSEGTYSAKTMADIRLADGTVTTIVSAPISFYVISGGGINLNVVPLTSTLTAPATFNLQINATGTSIGSIGSVKVELAQGKDIKASGKSTGSNGSYTFGVSNLAAGTYQVTAMALDGADKVLTTSPVMNVVVTSSSSSGGTEPAQPVISDPSKQIVLETGSPLRVLPLTADVSSRGAATFGVDIGLPIGSGGVKPTLGLTYDSQGGYGPLGIGWGISGLSSITRCPRQINIDGVRRAVTHTAEDRFCLDGQRLVMVKGDTYGAEGTEYRTYSESFSKIVSYGTSGTGPQYFKVWTKSGLVFTYGGTTESRLLGNAKASDKAEVLVWAQSSIADVVGNTIKFAYTNDFASGEMNIASIKYAENATTTPVTTAVNEVKFVYSTRNDASVAYAVGSKITASKLLKNIEVWIDSKKQYQYDTAYGTSQVNNRSLLQSIQRCVGESGAECTKPLTFSWDSASGGAGDFFSMPSAFNGRVFTGGDLSNKKHFFEGDFNGDGKTDLLSYKNDQKEGGQVICLKGEDNFSCKTITATWGEPDIVGDFNGDGMTDIAHRMTDYASSKETLAVCLSKGDGEFDCKTLDAEPEVDHQSPFVPGDFNGDGRLDYIHGKYVCAYTGIRKEGTEKLACDKWDTALPPKLAASVFGAMIANGIATKLTTPNSSSTNGASVLSSKDHAVIFNSPENPSSTGKYTIAEFNGDGRSDMLYIEPQVSIDENGTPITTGFVKRLLLASDKGFIDSDVDLSNLDLNIEDYASPGAFIPHVADVNGDGLPDILIFGTNYRKIAINEDGNTRPVQAAYCLNTGDIRSGKRAFKCAEFKLKGETSYWRDGKLLGQDIKIPVNLNFDNLFKGKIADFNGDGLADFAMYIDEGKWAVCSGTGSDWNCKVVNGGLWESDNDVRMGDYNGDGSTDFIRYRCADNTKKCYGNYDPLTWELRLGAAPYRDRIKAVDNSLLSAKFTYKSGTDSTVYTRPSTRPVYPKREVDSPVPVVSALEIENGLSAGGVTTQQYTYAGLVTNMEGGAPPTYTSRTVTAITGDITRSSTMQFRTDWPYAGMLDSQIGYVRKNGVDVKVSETTNVFDLLNGSEAKDLPVAAGSKRTFFPYVSSSIAKNYDPDSTSSTLLSTVETKTEYGAVEKGASSCGPNKNCGNPTTITVQTTGNDPVSGLSKTYKTTTVNTYYDNESSWYLARLTNTKVTHESGGKSVIRESSFSYRAADGLLESETVEPNQPDYMKTTKYAYDQWGNRQSSTVSGDSKAANPFTSFSSKVTYEKTGRFVETTENALKHTETKTYTDLGLPSTLTGPNGLKTKWEYDAFGQVITEYQAYGTSNQTKTEKRSLACTTFGDTPGTGGIAMTGEDSGHVCPSRAKTFAVAVSTGGYPVYSYYDAAGRLLRTHTRDLNGKSVFVDVDYTSAGQEYRRTRPYRRGDASVKYALTTYYDYMGRAYKACRLEHSGEVCDGIAYDGFSTTTTNALKQVRKETKNLIGKLVKVVDNGNNVLGYEYDVQGNLVKMGAADAQGNVLTSSANINEVDLLGRVTKHTDPNLGVGTSVYNALGQVVKKTNARKQDTTYEYDLLGRMIKRVDVDMTASWVYDKPAATTTKTLAKLAAPDCSQSGWIGALCYTAADNGYQREVVYDAIGRVSSGTTRLDASNAYTVSSEYDGANRAFAVTYPGNIRLRHVYNDRGQLKGIWRKDGYIWEGKETDAAGRWTKEAYGNGMSITNGYDAQSDRLISVDALTSANIKGVSQTYDYDDVGRLTSKTDSGGVAASMLYGYDKLNRLNKVTMGTTVQTICYDATCSDQSGSGNGRILSKSDVGSYIYGDTSHPDAVTEIQDAKGSKLYGYSYDASGNMLTGKGGNTYSWYSFNQPKNMTGNGHSVDFLYDVDYGRVKETDNSKVTLTINPRLDLGHGWQREIDGSKTTDKVYVSAAGHSVAVIEVSGTQDTTRWMHTDMLGSVVAVSDAKGSILARYRYDAWGKRIVEEGATVTRRGYTGHEEIESLGLINMNGRVYDPMLARFMGADPVISDAGNWQSYNGYSYVANNPLIYTDPTGFSYNNSGLNRFFGTITGSYLARDILSHVSESTGQILVTLASMACGGAAPVCAARFSYDNARAHGASGGDAVQGGIQAGTFAYVNQAIGGSTVAGSFENIALHALVGGVQSDLAGDSFFSGAFAGGLSSALAPKIDGIMRGDTGFLASSARVSAAAVLGGTASVIAGGKFANGAIVAAFDRAYNAEGHLEGPSTLEKFAMAVPLPQGVVDAAGGFGDGVSSVLTFGTFSTADARKYFDIGGVDSSSGVYKGAKATGYVWGVGTNWSAGLNGGANSVFWSGSGNLERAMSLGRSLESTPIGSLMNQFGSKVPYWMWKAASATYAANAKGVALKVGVQSGNIWRTIEQPILNWRNILIKTVP